ncbi:hypothetical protein GCM10009745_55430 [Kribbella yunnanensis]|uniref:DUF4383 domain-containing protein n=1 Tax=Kribbella yunnanensis TaxID=190194 RepID=A0ABP4UCL2_9ACTN
MRNVYRVVAILIAVSVALQVASIAMSGFTMLKDANDGAAIGADYSNFGQMYHSIGGSLIALLALILLIVSFLTDVPRGRALAGIIVGLVALQFALAAFSFGLPALGVLHGLNGLAVGAVAGSAIGRAAAPRKLATPTGG